MAAPVIESWTVSEGNEAVTSIDIDKPSGVQSGDLLVLITLNDKRSDTNAFNTTGTTGFTFEHFFGGNDSATQGGYWSRVADGTEGSTVTVNVTETLDVIGWYLRISGADTDDPFDVLGANYQGINLSSFPITSATTTVDDCLGLYALSFDGGNGDPFSVSGGNGTGWTEIDEAESNSALASPT